jgi:hypothetical protein
MKKATLTLCLTAGIVVSACSLDARRQKPGNLIINIDNAKSAATSLAEDFGLLVMGPPTGPTSISDFSCFAVNVTGAGVTSQVAQLQNCTTTGRMQSTGIGMISKTVPTGTPIVLNNIPSGRARTIDVYGVFPPPNDCTGSSGSSGSSGGNGGGSGYFLGTQTMDLSGDTSVTIGTSYGGSPADVTCTGGSNSVYPTSFTIWPDGGGNTVSTLIDVLYSGGSNVSGAAVTVGGTSCTGLVPGSNGNFLQCTVPSGVTTGPQTAVLSFSGGPTINYAAAFTVVASGSWIAFSDNSGGQTGRIFNFGTQTHGSPGPAHTINICNSAALATLGNSTLNLPNGFIYTGGSNAYTSFPGSGGTCGLGGTISSGCCTISVQFSPPVAGSYGPSGVQFVPTGDNGSSTLSFTGSGT